MLGGHAPQPQAGLRDHELMAQLGQQHLGQRRRLASGAHDGQRPAVQPVGDRDVVLAVADHLDDPQLQALDLVAQHLGLALLQRHGAGAVRMLQLHAGQQRRMALEETGGGRQVVGDVGFGDALHRVRGRVGTHSSISPSKTLVAGPVISTELWPPAHSIFSWPPRVCTSTTASSQPKRMPATTAAQAPVPQASVSPASRSNTRSAMRSRASTCMKPALTRRAKRACPSICGPCVATGAA
mmetsp:Transcript_10793/g.29567  ORF Transcript_10793/g.29567 Transcript_10793/m.29567 type:complete len:240 (-) Transcript_10793:372-1091(-)